MTHTHLDPAAHWDAVYTKNPATQVSWYEPVPTASVELIEALGVDPEAAVIDIGGGASTLVDALVARGWRDVTVLDISPAALAAARERLSGTTSPATWITADLLRWQPARHYDLWHDRAVFHFLTAQTDRDRYRQVMSAAVRPGGHVILGTFSPHGPDSCSGLPTARYDADQLAAELGEGFELVSSRLQAHLTPSGRVQEFTWVAARRVRG